MGCLCLHMWLHVWMACSWKGISSLCNPSFCYRLEECGRCKTLLLFVHRYGCFPFSFQNFMTSFFEFVKVFKCQQFCNYLCPSRLWKFLGLRAIVELNWGHQCLGVRVFQFRFPSLKLEFLCAYLNWNLKYDKLTSIMPGFVKRLWAYLMCMFSRISCTMKCQLFTVPQKRLSGG